MLKLPCPNCNQALSLPDRFAGKTTKCPACQHSFIVPGGPDPSQTDVASLIDAPKSGPAPQTDAAVAPSDRLAVQALMEQAEREKLPVQQEAAVEACPGCGAKWKRGESTCPKCHYNIYAAKKVRPAARGRIIPDVRFDKILLFALIAAALYGGYWLYENFTDVRRKGIRMYDEASRAKIEEVESKVAEQQGAIAPLRVGKPMKVAVVAATPKLDDVSAALHPGNAFVVVTLDLGTGESKQLVPDDYVIADPAGEARKPLGFKPATKSDFETLSRHLITKGGTLRIGKNGSIEADSLDLLYEVPAGQQTLELQCGARRFKLKPADGTVDAMGK